MTKKDGPVAPASARTGERTSRTTTVRGARRASTAAPRARKSTVTAMPKAPEPMDAGPVAEADRKSPPMPEPATGRTARVRQTCRLTAGEYAELTALKKRAAALARPAKRGELLRAGLYALRRMDDAQLFALLDSLPDAAAARA